MDGYRDIGDTTENSFLHERLSKKYRRENIFSARLGFQENRFYEVKDYVLRNILHKSRFRVLFFRFAANRCQTFKSTYEKLPIISAFVFCSFIMRAQTQTGSKARSINIRERSVARRRREQMNNILIDRPEKKL